MGKLFAFIILSAYVWGVWKFWIGYKYTNFQPSLPSQIILSLLWPGLLIFNKSYRKNFQKALRGR